MDPLATGFLRRLAAGAFARFTCALTNAVAGADLVIAWMDRNGAAFGWDIPVLRRAIAARGGRFPDIGVGPFRPGAAWQDHVGVRIAEALA